MPKNDPLPVFPTRGTPGGWRDWWDGPDEASIAREQIEASRRSLVALAKREGRRGREELAAQKRHPRGVRHA